jgi:D-cysteine desulfhydrase
MKRDDQLGLAGGGNKTRKLEFLAADALAQGCDTLITCGAVQSNHCRLTLAAACKEGMKCRLVLEERVPGTYDSNASGNNFLYQLMDVEKIRVLPAGSDMLAEMQAEAEAVAGQGRKAYVIPGGASNAVGALGYVACAQEIASQLFEADLHIDRVICASGSAGTHAGLVTGFTGSNTPIPVVGINVSRTKEIQEKLVYELAEKVFEYMGLKAAVTPQDVLCFGDYVGPGYSLPTKEMVKAVEMLARSEAILLDPVYTGKTMAGLIDLVQKDFFKAHEKLLFVHTGGSPALYHYLNYFRS